MVDQAFLEFGDGFVVVIVREVSAEFPQPFTRRSHEQAF